MDIDDFFVGVEVFRRGEARPLPMPESVRAELTINALSEERRRGWEATNGPIVGYQFPWGQIHEDPTLDAGPDEIVMEWHFVLSDLHTEFLRAGGCLGELSDCYVEMLDRAEECARQEPHQEVLPAYVSFCDGNALSAFSILVWGPANLPAAREWVAGMFIPGMLPILVENASRINHEAGRNVPD
jgi:hypothetical protein